MPQGVVVGERAKEDDTLPWRKPVILVGAPSGAGKTVLSRHVIQGRIPLFDAWLGSELQAAVRYDIARPNFEPPRDRILLIECATHRPERLIRGDAWRRMLDIVRGSEKVMFVTLEIPTRHLVQQYFSRIFAEPTHKSLLWRAMQVSKYRNVLLYLLSGQVPRAQEFWAAFGKQLEAEMPSRLAKTRARRAGDGFEAWIEQNAATATRTLAPAAADPDINRLAQAD